MQIAVPVLLVLLALWGGRASAAFPQQPPLPLDRCVQAGLHFLSSSPNLTLQISLQLSVRTWPISPDRAAAPCTRAAAVALARRATALSGNPPAFGAAADVRSAGGARLDGLLAAYPGAQVRALLRRLPLDAAGR